ncbi:MAG: sporulation protein YqfC [Lachnospiraceae bacterium]
MKIKKQEKRKESHSIKEKMAQLSEMPKDVVMGMPMLTMMGQMELCIENYRGIIEYTELLVRVQTKTGQIRITGNHLRVDSYTNDEMKVTGHIETIEYLK